MEDLKNQINKMIFPSDVANNLAIERLEKKDKYEKANCDMEELIKQQELLKQVMLSNGKQDFFTVFDMECNLGKTYTAINTIPYYLEAINKGLIAKKGIIIVVREISECDKYEKELNELYEPFDKVALAFHSDKYKSKDLNRSKLYKQDLIIQVEKYPVVLITHQNYLNLALDKKARNTFTKNRRLLIVDESIDICKTLTLKKSKMEQIINALESEDKEKFIEISNPILEKIEELEQNENEISNMTFNFKVEECYFKLIEKFSKEVIPKYREQLKNDLEETITTIECIYTDTCLISKSEKKQYRNAYISFSTIDRKQKMWTLENNIILDGSATIEPRYKLNKDLYFVMNCKRVLDHSRWNIEYVFESTTKTSKGLLSYEDTDEQEEKSTKFYNACSEIIKDLGEYETFVVCNKDEHILTYSNGIERKFNPYENCNIPLNNIEHFGNITGKRDFTNLKNVIITHTPNYSETDYILQYMYYADTRYEDNREIKGKSLSSLDSIYAFDIKAIQDFKEKTIANHIYQAVCRVNREMKYKTKIVIISKYIGAILYVRDMLDCECRQTDEYNDLFESGVNKVNEERKENSKKKKMERLFAEIMQGNINQDIAYTMLNSHIVMITRDEIKRVLGYAYHMNKDSEKEKKRKDNAFDKTLNKCKEFIKDNGIIYVNKEFYIILDKPLK